MKLSDKIICFRRKLGWSQEQLANELGISRQSVSKWESGMSIPDLDKIVKLSELFGVSTDCLLKDEFEVENFFETSQDLYEKKERLIDEQEVHAYLQLIEKTSSIIAIAVAILIISSCPLIFLGGLVEVKNLNENLYGGIGLIMLLMLVIIGVVLLIIYGMKLNVYEYLEKEVISLPYGMESMIKEKQMAFEPYFRISIALGVGLCIFGVIPIIFSAIMGYNDFVMACTVCLLLVFVAIAVSVFIKVMMIYGSYQKLLQEGEYIIERKLANEETSYFPGIYWSIVTTIYLGYSFWYHSWGKSWIIWPVAGVLFASLQGIVNAMVQRKRL